MFNGQRMIALTIAIAVFFINSPAAYANNSDRGLTVMTYNMYPGTEFSEIFSAQSFPELMNEVAEAFMDVEYGNPEARISAIAEEIKRSNPTLVALQEAALWKTGPFLDPAEATDVSYDFLQILIDELAERGLHYSVISVQQNFVAELPATFTDRPPADVRYMDRVAIIARTDLNVSEFKLEAVNAGNFVTEVPFPHPVIGTVFIKRGWNSADVKMRGKTFRFVNAHLESFSEVAQYYQAFELLEGPANTNLPLIVAGDFNSDAEANGASYNLLLSVGLTDVWDAVNPTDPGYTWALFLTDPFTPVTPDQRLDLVFTRGGIRPNSARLVGNGPVALPAPIPSDHAGVIANVVLEP